MISRNFSTLRRRSIVRVLTPKKAAISSSVHCMPQSFSSSARSIFASGRAISFLLFEQPQFGAPVRERQAQSLQVRMPGADLRLDFRDLAAASLDSCCDSQPLGFDLRERPAVRLQRRWPGR